MNARIALGIAVMGLSLAACSAIGARPSASPDPTTSPAPSATPAPTEQPSPTPPAATPTPSGTPSGKLDNRQFVSVLVTQNGKSKVLVPGTKIRLGFSDGNISASAGCNQMGGDYKIVDGKLVVGQMYQTEIGCPTDLGDQDEWLANFLGSKPTITLDGNDLVLTSEETEITFLDREQAEPDQPLTARTWGLTTIITGEAASSVPEGATATLLFTDDGEVQIDFGCNVGSGQYTVDGDKIFFEQIISTKMACEGGKAAVEAAVLAVLNADEVTYSIDHASLTLQAGDNGLMYDAALDSGE